VVPRDHDMYASPLSMFGSEERGREGKRKRVRE